MARKPRLRVVDGEKVEANARALSVRALNAAAEHWRGAVWARKARLVDNPAWCHCPDQCSTLGEHWEVLDRCAEMLRAMADEVKAAL